MWWIFWGDPCGWGTTFSPKLLRSGLYLSKYFWLGVLAVPTCKVIADKDDEGPIGVVDTAIATSSSLEKAHPLQELSRPPQWWSKRCIGDRCASFTIGSILRLLLCT